MLVCDNAAEFSTTELKNLVENQFGGELVHSEPGHPETNGVIEQYNDIMKERIINLLNASSIKIPSADQIREVMDIRDLA